MTENTNFRRHKTGRICPECSEDLFDSIVHFGEQNQFDDPYRWSATEENVEKADLIITIGTSLKVLKAYSILWPKKATLAIVNLQKTPKDRNASLILNGECDYILNYLAEHFQVTPIPEYKLESDPLISLANAITKQCKTPITPMLESLAFTEKFTGKRTKTTFSHFKQTLHRQNIRYAVIY